MKNLAKFICIILMAQHANTALAEAEQPKIDASKPAASPAQDTTISRIRLFGQNGFGVTLYKNSACVGGDDSERVSGGFGSALGSFLGMASNESIGIPETEATKNLSQRSGFMSKAYYKEYKIDSGKPVTVSMGFGNAGGPRCAGTISLTFIPKYGADYEGHLDIDYQAKVCRFVIKQVFPEGTTRSIETRRAPACS